MAKITTSKGPHHGEYKHRGDELGTAGMASLSAAIPDHLQHQGEAGGHLIDVDHIHDGGAILQGGQPMRRGESSPLSKARKRRRKLGPEEARRSIGNQATTG